MAPSNTEKPDVGNDSSAVNLLSMRQPDDMHLHLRDGPMLEAVLAYSADYFGRAIIMPNLQPPVLTVSDATHYYERIKAHVKTPFEPLMTLYLSDNTTEHEIRRAKASGLVRACKLYPCGVTTNSSNGVTSIDRIDAVLRAMEEEGLVLCIHGEFIDVDGDDDIFDREEKFIERILPGIVNKHPKLRIVLEHITTKNAVDFIASHQSERLAASITPHHLMFSRQALFQNSKLHPHMFCLPVLKRDSHRRAILQAVKDDQTGRFFAGTDSAPHCEDAKLCSQVCAGIFNAHAAIALYADIFDRWDMLDKLEDFCSVNAAKFYGLPLNSRRVTLTRTPSKVVDRILIKGKEPVIPLLAGQVIPWTVSLPHD